MQYGSLRDRCCPTSASWWILWTEKIDVKLIPDLVRANFKLTPRGIMESLNLRRPIYRKTAAYGHFGRTDADFTWEATDKAAKLAADADLKREPVGARK